MSKWHHPVKHLRAFRNLWIEMRNSMVNKKTDSLFVWGRNPSESPFVITRQASWCQKWSTGQIFFISHSWWFLVVWKPVHGVSNKASFKPVSSATETSRGFWQSEFQTSLLSYRDQLENGNFTCSKFTYKTFRKANNIGADQTVQAGLRLCCSQTPEDRFSLV